MIVRARYSMSLDDLESSVSLHVLLTKTYRRRHHRRLLLVSIILLLPGSVVGDFILGIVLGFFKGRYVIVIGVL